MADRWSPPIADVAAGASRILYIMLLVAGGLIAGVALVFSVSSEMRGPALVIAGPPGLLLLGAAAWVRHRGNARRFTVHPEGVCERAGDRSVSIRFDQIEEIRIKAWQVQAVHVAGAGAIGAITTAAVRAAASGGRTPLPYDATQVAITLRAGDREVVLRKWDEQWLDAYQEIRARVEPRLLGLARAELARTGAATFGPVRLEGDDLAIGKKRVPLAELETIDVDFARITLKRRGKRLPAAVAPLRKTPNVHVLLDLVGERRPHASA